MDPRLHGVKEALDAVLASRVAAPTKDHVERVMELVRLAYEGATPTAWSDVMVRVQEHLGMDGTEIAALLGEAPAKAPTPYVPVEKDATFEGLVPKDSWFGRYLEWSKESEAPAQFHFGAALVSVAASLGRKPLIDWPAMPTYPNLYGLIVGPTGARKSTALRMATTLVKEAMPNLNILPAEGSQQGYARALRRRFGETGTMADGIIAASELTVLIGRDKYKQDLHKWLTDWYDSPEYWARALSGDEYYELHNLYTNFLGASNMQWLRDIPVDAVRGGFLPRCLIFEATAKRHAKANPQFDPALRQHLVDDLRERLSVVPERMGLDKAANDYLDLWYTDSITVAENHEHDELFAAWLSRKLPAALKIACCWQLVDRGNVGTLSVEYLDRARKVVDWMDTSVRKVYSALGVTAEGEVAEVVMGLLKKAGGRMSQSEITRRLRNRWRATTVKEALYTLRMSQDITADSTSPEGTVWILHGVKRVR